MTPETPSAPKTPGAAGDNSSPEASLLPTCGDSGGWSKKGNEPCPTTRGLRADGLCIRHSHTTSAAEKAAWSRLGGFRATRRPLGEDVPTASIVTRLEVSQARSEVYSLVRSQAISAPVGNTLGKLLADADAARSRDEALALERRRQVTTPKVVVQIASFARMLPQQALSVAASSTSEADPAVPLTYSGKRDTS